MFGQKVNLFRLFGFQVGIDASWLFIAVLIAWSLAVSVFPTEYPELPYLTYWMMGLLGMLGLFASIVVHELCHSLVARRYGLNMKGITLFIFGGVAEMSEEPRSARVEMLMAAAGPAASFAIGAFFLVLKQTIGQAWPVTMRGVVGYLGWINVTLAVFNLIPAFPLDGGRILRAILWRWKGDLMRATKIAARVGTVFSGVLIVVAAFQLFAGQFVSAVWMFMIAMFIRSASHQSYEQLVMRNALQGVPVRQFMKTEPVTVSPDLSVAMLVDEYMYRHHYKVYPVVEDDTGEVIGCVGTSGVRSLSREKWPWKTVRDIMTACAAENTITPDTDALTALTLMTKTGNSRLMVVENDRLVAMLTLRDLMRYLAMKLELGARTAGASELTRPGGFGSHHPAPHHSA